MKPFFDSDTYKTPENKRNFMDKMFLGTRWYFMANHIKIILRGSKLALQNKYDSEQWALSSINSIRLLENCGANFHIEGMDNIKNLTEPVVFISNHMSTLETFAFPCLIQPHLDVTFVVKESLTKDLLFGPLMRARNPIVVKRQNPRDDFEAVMSQGTKLLKSGTSIIIFPQSTRNTVFTPSEFNTLGIKLAKAAGVKVLPIAIKTDFWKPGSLIKEIGSLQRKLPIHIKFDKPIAITANGKEQHKQIIDFISTNYIAWGGQVKD